MALALALALAACAVSGLSAFAQNGATPPPAGAAFEDEEPAGGFLVQEPAPPPPSDTACGAQNCIVLEMSADALRAVEQGGDPAAFGQGLTFAYEGARPPAIYFVAARYNKGRLEQYETTPWIRPEGEGAGIAIQGVAEAVAGAASLYGRPPAALAPASEGEAVWTVPVSMQGFVVESPHTVLLGEPDSAPVDAAAAPPALTAQVENGPVLLVAFVPSDTTLRAPDRTRGAGAVIPLADRE